jgi:outer membrane receptor for ferric coprogen and ferric-rhodotorulic acid
MNIELTQEQVAAFNRGESITITLNPKPKQWEPRGGRYLIEWDGIADMDTSCDSRVNFGIERQNVEAANKARDAMCTHNRLLAYVDEFGGDWEADWKDLNQQKCFVSFCEITHMWVGGCDYTNKIVSSVYMSPICRNGLITKLESGEVVL